MKVLVFSPSDGSVWRIPADVIAKHRARYYAEIDSLQTCGDEFNKAFKSEVEYALSSDYELLDWARNNMDWSAVQPSATQVKPPSPDYQEDWVNGQMEIKEVPND